VYLARERKWVDDVVHWYFPDHSADPHASLAAAE
jgi:hypothetical protein